MGGVQPGSDRRTWQRYIALGDSFTEGLSDPDPAGPDAFRGWADRLAEHLAAAAPAGGIEYANLAIRGRLLPQVLAEQVPVALAAGPDLVSLVAGGNDLLRRGRCARGPGRRGRHRLADAARARSAPSSARGAGAGAGLGARLRGALGRAPAARPVVG
jgi:lysophospholipase L1-like esterase